MQRACAVIFDMDGLMIDSERLAIEANKRVNAELGLGLDEALFYSFIGKSRKTCKEMLLEVLESEALYEQFWGRACEVYYDLFEKIPDLTKPGLHALVEYLELERMPWGIGTSTEFALAERKLKQIGIKGREHALVAGDQVARTKPAPDVFLKVAAMMGAEPCHCLVLEDSEAGVMAAHAAGMQVFHVPDLMPTTDAIREKVNGVYASLVHFLEDFQKARALV